MSPIKFSTYVGYVFHASSTEVVFRPTQACFDLLGKEIIGPPRKKHDSPILIKKNASRRRPGKMTDRGSKKKHHRMTSIENYLIVILQLLNRDWIENNIPDIGRCKAATNSFSADIAQVLFTNAGV